jgi:hypothetical protein
MDKIYSITISQTPTILIDTTIYLYIDKNKLTKEYKGNKSKSDDNHLNIAYKKHPII